MYATLRDGVHITGISDINTGEYNIMPQVGIVGLLGGAAAVETALRGVPSAIAASTTERIFGGLSTGVGTMGVNALRVTPTLAAAVVGPAIADGVTSLFPNHLKKVKTTIGVTDPKQKLAIEADNAKAKLQRWFVGFLTVGAGAGLIFLARPTWFPKDAFGQTRKLFNASEKTLQGYTNFTATTSLGKSVSGSMIGVLNKSQVTEQLAKQGTTLVGGVEKAFTAFKSTEGIARNAAFSNRMLAGVVGGAATLALSDRALGADGEKARNLGIAAAVTGAATVGGIAALGKLTALSANSSNGVGGLLAKNELFYKPNWQWFKDYFARVAPVTAFPAGISASLYYNIVSDIFTITDARSQFRK